MKIAFLYAGQGSQKTGMGQDIYDKYEAFRNVIDNADTDFDLKKMMFENPEDLLNITRYTQPCMAAFAAGVTDILYAHNIKPEYVAGLSLGEYSALYGAGVWDEKKFIDLVAFRGRAMDDASKNVKCAMSAVLGIDSDLLSKLCERVREENEKNYVVVSNYNCTGQYVICGDEEAVCKAENLAKENGAKRCIRLKVSGPFHTKFMEPAANALKEKFEKTKFNDMKIPVIFNTTASFLGENETVPELLERQVKSSIYMEKTILKLKELGVDTVIEIGPGKVLSGFIKKTVTGIECYNIESVQDVDKIIEIFG